MARPLASGSAGTVSTPGIPESCPSCRGPLTHGFLGTNGNVFWSAKEHFLGVVGDEGLIPRAILRTSYRPAGICHTCGLVLFLLDDGAATGGDLDGPGDDASPPD